MRKKPSPEYTRNHYAVRRLYGPASDYECANCDKPAREWAQMKDKDGSDPSDYDPMCNKCHQEYDDHWTQETREKVAASVKKNWDQMTEEERDERGHSIANGKTGTKYNLSDEQRKAIGDKKRGNSYASGKRTPEQCERIRIARWGR